ncbi:SprT family zinc-dependent metalloprotease [Sphingomicrobium sp. XHP0235]|uniref:M48 family metallopeptidase n=1 Tax=Sphingomicrobium aquimarinum TaxID=3133971 RepID=UPI0031FE6B6C
MNSEHFPDIDVVRHARARRFLLRYDPVRDRLRLTLPKRASERAGLRWAATQGEWVERQRSRRAETVPLTPGATIPFRGRSLLLEWQVDAPRRVRLEGDRLVTGGPVETAPRRYAQWLRAEALRLLSDESAHFAALAGVPVRGVAVGDARSRWGSCSADGRLRFSWRLVCAPDAVRRYVVAHEVAHRVHMNHGPAFRALEAALVEGDVRALSKELNALGPRLQRIGR